MLCFVLSCVCYAIWNFTHPEIIHQNLELLNVNNIQAMLNDPPTIHDNCPKQSQASVGSHRWDAMQVSKMDLRPPLSPMLLGKTCDAATRPTTWNKTPLRNLENKERENINLAKTWVLLLLRGSLTCCLAKFPKLFFFYLCQVSQVASPVQLKDMWGPGASCSFQKNGHRTRQKSSPQAGVGGEIIKTETKTVCQLLVCKIVFNAHQMNSNEHTIKQVQGSNHGFGP